MPTPPSQQATTAADAASHRRPKTRRTRRRHLLAVALVALGLAGREAPAGPADALIAETIRPARSDADRAGRLLAKAKGLTGQPAVRAAVLTQALDYGLKAGRAAAGRQAAAEALALLDQADPKGKARRLARRLDVRRLSYRYAKRTDKRAAALDLLDTLRAHVAALERAGRWDQVNLACREAYSAAFYLRSPLKEQIAFRRLRAAQLAAIARQVELETRKLASEPDDDARREKVLELLVIELNDPNQAAKLLAGEAGQTWRTYLPLARQDPSGLSESAAAELGRWAHELLAPKAGKFSQLRVLMAARDAYERAVTLHQADDAQRTVLQTKLAQVEGELDDLVMQTNAAGRAAEVDLRRSLQAATLDQRGIWDSAGGVLTTWPRPDGYLRLPVELSGSYRLSIDFILRTQIPIPDRLRALTRVPIRKRTRRWLRRKIDTPDGLDVAFPLGAEYLALSIMPTPRETTVELVDVAPSRRRLANAASAAAGKGPGLSTERLHRLDIAVFVAAEMATIHVRLNRRPLLRWKGKTSRCGLDGRWPPVTRPGRLLLGGWRGPTSFMGVKLCCLSGQVRITRPDPAAKAP